MNKYNRLLIITAACAVIFSGCAMFNKPVELTESYDTVLVYELPYDLTYLRAMEAVSFIPDWELEETEKEKGVIVIRNTNFRKFTDADQRVASIFVKRVSRRETSVELAPFSRKVLGGEMIMDNINELISREL